jgi:PhnB protein
VTRKSKLPDYHTVTAYLMCKRAARVIAFLRDAFGAEEIERITGPRGKVLHAELRVGDSRVMLGEPGPDMPRLQAMPAHHYVFVTDVHASYERALAAGAKSFSKPVGPRLAAVTDPGGNFWWIGRRELVHGSVIKRRNRAYVEKKAKTRAA